MSTNADGVAGVLLGAGAASRFGGDKLAAPFRGQRLIDHSAQVMKAAELAPIVLVTQPQRSFFTADSGVLELPNPNWRTGLASSVAAALGHLAATDVAAAIFAPADQPLLTPQVYQRLLAQWSPQQLSVASYQGKLRNPVLLPRRWWPQAVLITGDVGLAQLYAQLPVQQVECGDIASVADVDTRADLDRLR